MSNTIPNVRVTRVVMMKKNDIHVSRFKNPTLLHDAIRMAKLDIRMLNPREKLAGWKHHSHQTI